MSRDDLERLERALAPDDLEVARAYLHAARRHGASRRAHPRLIALGWTLEATLARRWSVPEALRCAVALLEALAPVHAGDMAFGGFDPRAVMSLPGEPWYITLSDASRPQGGGSPRSHPVEFSTVESGVVVVDDLGRGARSTLTWHTHRELVFGSGGELVREDPLVSRHHARVLQRDGRVILVDLQSVSGTWVSGARMRAPQVIRGVDRVGIGRSVIAFHHPSQPPIPLYDLHLTPPGPYRSCPEDDLYVVACALHQMLIGRPLFEAESAGELMHAHAQATRPALPTALPEALRRLLDATLAAERVLRPSRAEDMLSVLRALQRG